MASSIKMRLPSILRCGTFGAMLHEVLTEKVVHIPYCLQFSDGEQGVKKFQATLEPLRKTLSEYPFLGGNNTPSYADILVFGFFMVCIPPYLLCYPIWTLAMITLLCVAEIHRTM